MKKGRKFMWAMLAVVFIVIITALAVINRTEVANTGESENEQQTALEATEDISLGSVNTGVGAVSLSYTKALADYKDRRIQIDDKCQLTPNTVTYANNTNIMFDNRSASGHTFKIGSLIGIKAYGFKIVNLSAGTLPAKILVDCDAHQNVGTILLQK